MHVQGVVEYRDGQSWLGGTDLPHLPPDACPPVFGVPENSTGSADPTIADYERECGAANVRLVVWFEN